MGVGLAARSIRKEPQSQSGVPEGDSMMDYWSETVKAEKHRLTNVNHKDCVQLAFKCVEHAVKINLPRFQTKVPPDLLSLLNRSLAGVRRFVYDDMLQEET